MTELKPCPFCGVVPEIRWEKWSEISEDSGVYVLEALHNDKCYFVSMNGTNNKARKSAFNKECLIEAWNTRAEQTEPKGEE